jgi:hypothetical protein
MTRQQCEDAYNDLANEATTQLKKDKALVEKTTAEAEDAAKTANTGSANASADLPTSTFTDFFNLLHTSATAGSGGGDDPQALAFELNSCGVPYVGTRNIACQLRARAQKPALYDPLKKALEAADLATQANDLDDQLDVTDQVTIGAFLSLVGDKWGSGLSGRSVQLYTRLKNEADAAALAATGIPDTGALARDITRFLTDLLRNHPDRDAIAGRVSNANLTFAQIFPPDLVDQVVAHYEEYAKNNVALTTARFAALKSLRAPELANLINQQPQLYFGAEYGAFSEFAGPDEWRAKLAFETGFVNVNDFTKYAERSCTASDGSVAACLKSYLHQPGIRQALEAGSRASATLEYVSHKRYDVTVPNTTVAVSADASSSLIGSVAISRYLGINVVPFAENGQSESQKTRLDLVASYEDVSDDPARQDRGIASLTLSRQLSDDWVLAVGVVYATKPEFRAAADKDVSLRLGLNYKILRKTP